VTAVSLEHAVAAPFATRQLADLGARVIKIERPSGGDFARQYDESVNGLSSYFVWLNRSKESVAVDVKSSGGRAILADLVDTADVVVQNLGPGAAARLGLSATELHAKDPGKIVLNITGWGSTGPWEDRKAYDLLVQCETGLVSLTGTPDDVAKVGVSVADIAAGMSGFSGVLAALYRRASTGEGAAIATIAPCGPYDDADGHTILLAIQNEPEWERFCRTVLERPDLVVDERFAGNSRRVDHRDELDVIVAECIGRLNTVVAETRLAEAGVAFAGVNTVSEFLKHPVLDARDRWRSVDTEKGSVRALHPPIGLGEEARMGPVPAHGAHTAAVLRELGLDSERIATLRDQGIINADSTKEEVNR
jgi:crotonobetainyl-CoA:carnitine CoA-transferase CaiB-like acyl-CoA transferase